MKHRLASIAIVVPCYNEAARFKFSDFRAFIADNPSIHLCFVDDGSKDATVEVLQKNLSSYSDSVSIIRLTKNAGKAEAVRQGMLAMLDRQDFTYIGFWDADLATPLSVIKDFTKKAEENPFITAIIGARVQLSGRWIHRSRTKHYLGRLGATAISHLLKLYLYDTQCGAKIFRVIPKMRELFSKPFLSKWLFDVEIFLRLSIGLDQGKPCIYEYPLEKWEDIGGSKVSATTYLFSFFDLINIVYRYKYAGFFPAIKVSDYNSIFEKDE